MEQIPIHRFAHVAVPKLSRDEMNLAEFPLTVLSTRSDPSLKTLEFKDSIKGRNGELVDRHWIITGADKFGLPTASDDEVLLGLLKLTVDDEFRSRKVYFTRYELLRILKWSTEGRSYQRLQKALDRLSGVRIKATNAFYDNESKAHSTRNFGLIDAYEINDGRSLEPKPSFFTWSDVLYKSFQVGFIKKFDLDFFLGLQSAVSRRLYRYLDKHFWYRSRVQISLFTLAHEKIGISRNYQYASSLRQQLDPALHELIERGFVSKVEYLGKGQETLVCIFAGSGARKLAVDPGKTDVLDPNDETGSEENQLLVKVTQLLVARGIKAIQVSRLFSKANGEMLERVIKIVEHFDHLVATRSYLVSRSPVGFLYRAIENPRAFVLPEEAPKFAQAELRLGAQSAPSASAMAARKLYEPKSNAPTQLETQYLIERRQQILRLKSDVEPNMLAKLTKEVEQALGKLRGLISGSRFEQAVEHGVEEKLAKLFAMPTFEEWSRKHGKRTSRDL